MLIYLGISLQPRRDQKEEEEKEGYAIHLILNAGPVS